MTTHRPLLPICLALLCACGTTPEGDSTEATDTDVAPVEPRVWTPGPARVHRLTRAQLGRSLHDLLGVDVDVSTLPADAQTAGFDNTETSLTVPPGYLPAWYRIVRQAAAQATYDGVHIAQFDAAALSRLSGLLGDRRPVDQGVFHLGDASQHPNLQVPFTVPVATAVQVHLTCADPELPENAVHIAAIDGTYLPLDRHDPGDPCGLTGTTAVLQAGTHTLSFDENTSAAVDLVQLDLLASPPKPRTALPTQCTNHHACAGELLLDLRHRATRAPVDPSDHYEAFVLVQDAIDRGEPFQAGVASAVEGILLSPSFLFRTEHDTGAPLTSYEVASRLSFLLWSSLPDDALLTAAEANTLLEPEVLRAQVTRMLHDPRSDGFVDDMLGQWLGFRDVSAHPALSLLDPDLQAAMTAEGRALGRRLLTGDLTLSQAFTTTTAHIEAPLDLHYGVAAGPQVDVASTGRVGVLGQASWLAFTSQATRTSPVRRGEGIIGRLLCDAPGAPPAGINTSPPDASPQDASSDRRAQPSCRVCHDVLDPTGLAMEHFDAQGQYRDAYADETPVNSTSTQKDGTTFTSLADLAAWVAKDPRLDACFVEQVTTWTYGRRLADDHPVRARALQAFEASGGSVPALIEAIVLDEAFRLPVGAL